MKPLRFDRFFRLNALLILAIALGVVGLGWGPVFFRSDNGGEYGALYAILVFFGVDFGGTVALVTAALAQIVGWLARSMIGTVIGLIFQLVYGAVYTWVGIQMEFLTPASLGAVPALGLAAAGLAILFTTPKGQRRWQPRKSRRSKDE